MADNAFADDPSTPIVQEEPTKDFPKPSQAKLEKLIDIYKKELDFLKHKQDSGLTNEDLDEKIKECRGKLLNENKNLKRLKSASLRQKKFRVSEKLKKLANTNPQALGISPRLAPRASPGQPKIIEKQPLLLDAITKIVMRGSSADERRRTNTINTCKTLTQLTEELHKMGFEISRSSTYYHLLPQRSNTIEGKRHIDTVPVRLRRAENNLHRQHPDSQFATASIRNLETLASILGPDQVIFLSQDDKARVPLGITAANKEAPVLMHLDYHVKLPDHDWVVAEKHKLIPSVIAGIEIKSQSMAQPDAVSYSGPTYIGIRSGKHSSSTAHSHAINFDRIFNLDSFSNLVKVNKKLDDQENKQVHTEVKPIVMLTVDGGPDENPRYCNVVRYVIKHFLDYNLDAFYLATNAPGRSAYNRVERRMAPLSRQLSGLVLPYDHYGSHLDSKKKTSDIELEKKNFEHAGKYLAEIWSNIKIDGHDVKAEYISDDIGILEFENKSPNWYCTHVRESQYILQVVKCDNSECCSSPRSSLKSILKDGFLPAPMPLMQGSSLSIPKMNEMKEEKFAPFLLRLAVQLKPELNGFKLMPYDFYCPSVQAKLKERTCNECNVYFASKKSLEIHKKAMHPKLKKNIEPLKKIRPLRVAAKRANELMCIIFDETTQSEDVEWLDSDAVDYEATDVVDVLSDADTSHSIPVIESMDDWLEPTWTNY